jgi:hypothetical protein
LTKVIEITVSPSGETRLETKGFTGRSCQLASIFLELTLGKKQSDRMTGEFYVQETNQARLQEGR